MRTKAVSLLLSLSLLGSLAIPGTLALPTRAVGEQENNGMVISKTAEANDDGTYTISLEAYATGDKVITETKKDVPTDIVLVLDQSGSMADPIGEVSFKAYTKGNRYNHTTNSHHYEMRHNGGKGNLYYPLSDGAYASVSVAVEQTLSYRKITDGRNNNSWGSSTNYWNNRNNLYAKLDGEYVKVTVTREDVGEWWYTEYEYTYKLPNGTVIATSTGDSASPTFSGTDDNVLYLAEVDNSKNVYTYTYTDSNGTVQTIGTSTGADVEFPTTLYERVVNADAGTSRLNALKSAVTTFTNSVAEKAAGSDGTLGTDDDVNHRIALVGFASSDSQYNRERYENTEVFVGGNTYKYGASAVAQYGNALQAMNTTAGQNNVTASINALDAYGGTFTNLGVEMANGILNANPVSGEKRNRVVIVFTDGLPGTGTYNSTVANSAIAQARTAKNAGTTVYSVGIFPGADASTAGNANGSETEKANWFMQNLSSNNGNVQNPSYYLSAADAGTLNSIFQQISNQIETGGAETTLGSETVVKDIISPYFTLPAGTTASDIRIDTYACTGKDGNTYTWSGTSGGSGGASATVNGDQVSVTGFDFSENWCGTETDAQGNTTVRGKKLVISFEVSRKSGFLGGNDVITNASAGIYENGSAQTPVMTFEQPTVNVPIKDVTVTAEDKNVYLKGEVTADQLKDGAEISVGDVKLDLSKDNYGLEDWQTEYVDITVTVKDEDGNAISDKLTDLTEDTTYTVEVTVAPKKPGTSTTEKGDAATAKTGVNDPAANIYVFKPELTFKDSTAYYGETVPTNNNYSGNQVGTEKWMHDGTAAVPSEMLGEKPTLDISFTPDESKLKDGKYTKQDVPVAATVKIGTENVNDYTTFVHQDCTTACGWETPAKPGAPAFLIHIQTCTLNITKQGGADNESYVFDVFKDGEKYSEVTVWGNGTETLVELPVGDYTIVENTGWSWRYTANNGGSAALTAQSPTGSITCVNTKNNNQWLNGFSEVVRNIFGTNH